MSRLDSTTWSQTFDGSTFEPDRDQSRLQVQLSAVRRVMFDGRWHTLSEISKIVGAPESSVSARLRDLRKAKFGQYTIDRAHISGGLWQYRMNCSATSDRGEANVSRSSIHTRTKENAVD